MKDDSTLGRKRLVETITELEHKVEQLQEALDTANRVLREHGLFGVLPDVGDEDEDAELSGDARAAEADILANSPGT